VQVLPPKTWACLSEKGKRQVVAGRFTAQAKLKIEKRNQPVGWFLYF